MLAFRPFDTNNAEAQTQLGISPPAKKCAKSPSKVPMVANLVYNSADC